MKYLLIINDAPYGTERAYNALRLAMALQKDAPEAEIRVFLMGDAVSCALPAQITAKGYYNIQRMLASVINKGGEVKLCGSCMDARGLRDLSLIEGSQRGSMSELAQWTADSEKILTL